MRGLRRWGCLAAVALFLLFGVTVSAEDFIYPPDTDGELVIVIDPGHGGENLGANYNGFLEKEMNMKVANAMVAELSKYQGITVYLTHDSMDTDMSIQSRADFAASVNADFLYCLHFNMSPDNKLFGSEVWVSAFGEENRQGYRFGQIQMKTMQDMGLYLRGVKTRFGEDGTDYYGILRFCEAYGIPAALIEHCHIDHEEDVGFCDSDEDLEAFGIADATSVARFFGLKSAELGVDYSGEVDLNAATSGVYAQADSTDPDVCLIEEISRDLDQLKVTIQVTACDYDTPMLYYAYSLDGGLTFTPYQAWPGVDMLEGKSPDTITLELDIPEDTSPTIVFRAVNQYDRYTDSNVLSGYPVFQIKEEETIPPETEETVVPKETEVSTHGGFKAPEKVQEVDDEISIISFLQISFIVMILILVAIVVSSVVRAARRQKRRKRKR